MRQHQYFAGSIDPDYLIRDDEKDSYHLLIDRDGVQQLKVMRRPDFESLFGDDVTPEQRAENEDLIGWKLVRLVHAPFTPEPPEVIPGPRTAEKLDRSKVKIIRYGKDNRAGY